jgi:uncharacterized protein (DUF362 family)
MAVELVKLQDSEYKRAIGQLFARVGYSPKGLVFIKPNLSAREYSCRSESTDPKFLHALVELLLENNCEVIIGHRSNLATKDMTFPFEKIVEFLGLGGLRKTKGVQVVNLDEMPTVARTFNEMEFQVPEILDKCESYINLAKLKTHMQTQVTLSLKNQMGLLPDIERRGMHKGAHLDKHIACLAKAVKPSVSIVEGVYAMEGDGPHHGRDKATNIAFAGDDMVELDSFATAMMSFDYKTVKHLVAAHFFGAGKYIDDAKIAENKKNVMKFKPAGPYKRLGTSLYVFSNDACPGCLKSLEEAGKKLKNDPRTALRFLLKCFIGRTNLIAGHCHSMDRKKLKGKVIGFGSCCKEFCDRHNVPHMDGCPLSSGEIKDFLYKELK